MLSSHFVALGLELVVGSVLLAENLDLPEAFVFLLLTDISVGSD